MRTLIFTVAILFMVPALRAQQDEPKQNPTQSVSQETTDNSNVQNSLPEAIRPGHPLDPASNPEWEVAISSSNLTPNVKP